MFEDSLKKTFAYNKLDEKGVPAFLLAYISQDILLSCV